MGDNDADFSTGPFVVTYDDSGATYQLTSKMYSRIVCKP